MTAICEQGSICAPAAPLSLDPVAIYHLLRAGPAARAEAEPFSAHVLACVLAIGLRDARQSSSSLGHAVGLGRNELEDLARGWLPGLLACIDLLAEPETMAFDDEEEQLRQLLAAHQASATPEALWLTAMITRRSMSGDHLWQDLGLLDRGELNRLMRERFPTLAARNVANMKWKKFFYRMLCELEGFTLCTAPSCRECCDFDNCFGAETGESALARIRRGELRAP
jgi:nitrogen fixation protein NifQ